MSLAVHGSFIGLVGSELLRVVYSDESGTGDEAQPITVVGALLLNIDSQWGPLERDLLAVKATIPIKLMRGTGESPFLHGASQDRELKGSLFFKALRGKLHGITEAQASAALAHVLSIATKHGIHIFHGAVNRAGRAAWCREHGFNASLQSDQEAAFNECVRRLDNFVHTFTPSERVLWIADKTGFEKSVRHGLQFHQWIQTVDNDTLRKMFAVISNLSALMEGEEAEAQKQPYSALAAALHEPRALQVIDTIYFGASHDSLALQLADVCCAVITQYLLGNEKAKPFYNLIRQQVITDGTFVVYSDAWRDLARPTS